MEADAGATAAVERQKKQALAAFGSRGCRCARPSMPATFGSFAAGSMERARSLSSLRRRSMPLTARELFQSDLYRMFGRTDVGLTSRFGDRSVLHYLWLLRHAQRARSALERGAYRLALSRASTKTHIHIPWSTQIGPGFYIGHLGRVIINPRAVIGSNCNIATGVTIGAVPTGARAGCPRIGDRVWIGTNAVVVGGITIGNDVLIAPGALVNRDVPPGSTVIGNPGVIHEDRPCPPEYIQHPWQG